MRSKLMDSTGTACRPRAVDTATGKKVRNPATAVLLAVPVPRNSTTAGAMATIGTVCAATTSGSNELRTYLL